MKKLHIIMSLVFIICMVVSCRTNNIGDKHHAITGTLQVVIKTNDEANGDTDFTIISNINANEATSIGSNATAYIKNLDSGVRAIALKGMDPNCSVKGGNPRTIHISADDTTTTKFIVTCGSQVSGIKESVNMAISNHAFPGAAIVIAHDSTIFTKSYGHYTYQSELHADTPQTRFDLASLTKVIATTTAAMLLYDEGRLSLDQTVAHYLPEFAQNGKEQITIRQLLSHSSGLRAYINPLSTRKKTIDTILAQHLQYTPGTKSVYSGLNMITLMLVVNRISGLSFTKFCQQNIFDPLDMNYTGFLKDEKYKNNSKFAPTATNLQGVVNDPLARGMEGVSGNAGLFTTASDLAKFGLMYIQDGRINGMQFLKASTIKLFRTRAGVPNSNRALGWEVKRKSGYCSCGSKFGPQSFGHTGYTGTSIWFDPQQNLFGILLSNGTYPNGSNDVKTMSQARVNFYDHVYSSLVGL